MIQVTCPACGKALTSPDEKAGKTGRCPCGELIRLPEQMATKTTPPVIVTANTTDDMAAVIKATRQVPESRRIWWTVSFIFGLLIVLALTTAIVPHFLPERKPEIANSTLDFHAGVVNKCIYQMEDLLKAMDKEFATNFSSQLDPELRLRLDREKLDSAAKVTSMVRYSLKFDSLEKEMDKELKELKELSQQNRPNPRLGSLLNDLQKARDKVEGIFNALRDKIRST